MCVIIGLGFRLRSVNTHTNGFRLRPVNTHTNRNKENAQPKQQINYIDLLFIHSITRSIQVNTNHYTETITRVQIQYLPNVFQT
jgi:hypothetical protein